MKPQLSEDDRPPAELSLEEYLHSSWSPDCDFVDGCSEERNVGTFAHSRTVASLIWILSGKHEWKSGSILALPSLRIRVSPTRIRVPDICVIQRGGPEEQILTHPPLVVIQVLDDDDRFSAEMEKFADFERFGVEHIWAIGPERRRAYRFKNRGLENIVSDELTVPGTAIRLVLSEMFAELDR